MKEAGAKRLEVRLLGGFEARLGERAIRGFESQKARALFAYLALNRGQPIARERLAGLLWADRGEEAARRNLRQALHSVRTAFGDGDSRPTVVRADHTMAELDPELPCWIDVEVFRQAARDGLGDGGPNPHHLTHAARLYAGDLLSGFYVKGCPEFEEWMLAEQERLREEAVSVFRTLIAAYLARGEHRLGLQYARRLLGFDPLSEEANRHTMRLYWQAGQRSRALAQYEHLRNLLRQELGIEPLTETTELYGAILQEELPDPDQLDQPEPVGPIIPLVGRGAALEELQKSWSEVQSGRGVWTVVEGEGGVGKTRLIKAFVDSATSKRHAVVLAGGCYPVDPQYAFQPIREILAGAFSDLLPEESAIGRRLDDRTLADLSVVAPEIVETAPASAGREIDRSKGRAERLPGAIEALFEAVLEGESDRPTPLIVLLDDLHLADRATVDLLKGLTHWARQRPVWLLATARPPAAGGAAMLAEAELGVPLNTVPLARLEAEDVDEIAHSMAELSSVSELAPFLWRESGGLPLAVAELINFLWDEGALLPEGPGRWRLDVERLAAIRPPKRLDRLIHLRVARLPTSARRLLAQAAVIGHRFDLETLRIAADELPQVVDACVELILERWLARQYPLAWSRRGRRADLVLWASGVRRGWFEFAHKAIRDAILDNINPLRRGLMHRAYARALEQRYDDPLEVAERLAYHRLAAGDWAEALPALERSLENADRCGAQDVAAWYRERTLDAIDRRLREKPDSAEVQRLERWRAELARDEPEAARKG